MHTSITWHLRSWRSALVVATAVALVACVATGAQAASAETAAATPSAAKAPPRSSIGKARGGDARARAASCIAPMTGNWRNIDGATRSITRTVVDFDCQDVILCDIRGHCTGGDSSYYMRVFGKCHPTDCDWGRRRADDMGGGWIRSIYAFGWADKHVWLKTYSYYGLTYLRVWAHTDFAPWDGRTDYTTDEWFLR